MEWNELPLDPHHVRVSLRLSKMIFHPMVRSAPTMPLSCAEINTISKSIKTSFHLTYITWEFDPETPKRFASLRKNGTNHAPILISKPMVCSVQTVHISCTDINTISICTKTSFHLTHLTKEFHRLCPKWFLSLLHVSCKPRTHLASRLTLYSNGPKWATTWSMSCRSTIGCVQNDFPAYDTFGTNYAPVLR
jgi:hypothetical protein